MTMTVKATIADGRLRIDLPTDLPAGEVELEIVVRPSDRRAKIAELSDLIGKLEWTGDAVAEQRRLRDEWPD